MSDLPKATLELIESKVDAYRTKLILSETRKLAKAALRKRTTQTTRTERNEREPKIVARFISGASYADLANEFDFSISTAKTCIEEAVNHIDYKSRIYPPDSEVFKNRGDYLRAVLSLSYAAQICPSGALKS